MKLKITDLTVEKTSFRKQTDASGNTIREPYQANVKRKVNCVQGGKRLGHYMIDYVILFAINFLLALAGIFSSSGDASGALEIIFNIGAIFTTVVYYFALESTMGTTIGKLVTNSVVIDANGNKPSPSRLLGRSFARLIPLEAFSCLGEQGWHDTFSKTYVVTKTELATLKRLQREQSGEVHVDDREDVLD